MTREDLGITDTGLQYIVAIIHRGEIEKKYEWHRLASAIGAENPYYKEWLEAEAAVKYWQNRSREEYDVVMKQRGWYQHEN
jgi:hypothetical protein